MKTGKRRWIVLAVVLVLAAGWIWFSWPRSLEKLFPRFSWAEVDHVKGWYTYYKADPDPEALPGSLLSWDGTMETVEAGEVRELLELYEGTSFRRSLPKTLSANNPWGGSWSKEMMDGEIYVTLSFGTSDGYLFMDLYRDEARLFYVAYGKGSGLTIRGSFSGEDELAVRTLALLQDHAEESENRE